MADSTIAERIESLLAVDAAAFEDAVASEVVDLKRKVESGVFDNPQALVGMELELYAVDSETSALRRVPRWLLSHLGFSKELGLHNAELHTNPNPLNRYGLLAQRAELQARLDAARELIAAEDMRLVSDGMWTIPPTGETAGDYLTDRVDMDGSVVAANMSKSIRYHAFSNADYSPSMTLDAPNVELDAATPMAESLLTSIQPHYQVPSAMDLPAYFRYALRIAGPLLAISANSPFFPPDLYDDVSPERILEDAWMEHRIGVFESVLNPTSGPAKVRFPRDVESVEAAIDRIASDPVVVPKWVDERGRFDDAFRHFRHKHGTFWRWVRPVFDGASRGHANARIEFRPLPAQPTVPDAVRFQATFGGLLESLYRRDHPLELLEWDDARTNFYRAAEDGLGATFVWIDANGEETTDGEAIFAELFDHARDGLSLRGLPDDEIDDLVEPLRRRVAAGTTPARWKHRIAARELEAGSSLEEAIHAAQRHYIDRQADTLLDGSFASWIEG